MSYSFDYLYGSTQQILKKCGLDAGKAESTARILIEGDLLGHRTHGLQLLPAYVESLESGKMETEGSFEILNENPATCLIDGRYLPGIWLVEKAIDKAIGMAKSNGSGTVVIRKSHHIACLAAFLEKVARQNLVLLLACSDPANKSVAPFGGTTAVYSPDPLAMGIPTSGDPILIDVSMSATANGVVALAAAKGEKLGGPWLLQKDGQATNDPSAFFHEPPATVLPLGGMDLGYKGFALGMMIEVLTSALGGFGRADDPGRWGANVFVQVIDPASFAGQGGFMREIDYFKNACLSSQPLDPANPVRIPGEKALKLKARQLQNGLDLLPQTEKGFKSLLEKFGLT